MLMCVSDSPANASRSANVGLMLGQRLRRWPNIKSTLGDLPARTDRLGRDRVQVCADKHGQSTLYLTHGKNNNNWHHSESSAEINPLPASDVYAPSDIF